MQCMCCFGVCFFFLIALTCDICVDGAPKAGDSNLVRGRRCRTRRSHALQALNIAPIHPGGEKHALVGKAAALCCLAREGAATGINKATCRGKFQHHTCSIHIVMLAVMPPPPRKLDTQWLLPTCGQSAGLCPLCGATQKPRCLLCSVHRAAWHHAAWCYLTTCALKWWRVLSGSWRWRGVRLRLHEML